MARARSLERERFWRDVFERHARSGMSAAKFCRKEGLAQPSFYTWKQKLRQRAGMPAVGIPQADQGLASTSALGGNWLPVRIAEDDRAAAIRVVWPNGISAEIPVDCEVARAQDLLRLVDALARQRPGGAAC